MSANINNIEGGYKATLSNPKSSEEAKKHAQEMLDKIHNGENVEAANPTRHGEDMSEEEKHRHHIEGGYKATLSNPKSSEEAKKHAQEMLDKIANGEQVEESEHSKTSNLNEDEKHNHHVLGGYKATLSNPNSSEEAKKHAQEMLDKHEKGEELPESERRGLKRSNDDVESDKSDSKSDKSESGKGKQGFASMPKEKVQEIASKGGRTQNAGEEPSPKKSKSESGSDSKSDKSNNSNKDSSEYTEDEKHNHHVLGGYKATLSNPNSSEEAKKHAQEMLDKHEKGESNKSDSKSDKSDSKSDSKSDKSESGKGKQGFASMPKEKVQEIASKGGRTQNAGEEPSAKKSESDSKSKSDHSDSNEDEKSGKGKQGFASMPKEKVQEIASKGGRTKNAGEEPQAIKNK